MALREIKWFGPSTPVGNEVIQAIEQKLGFQLPPDFVECAKKYHGTRPDVFTDFKYRDPDFGPIETCLGRLLSFDLEDEDNILNTHKLLSKQLPPGVVPFGEDGGGDYMCFDFRSNERDTPVVYFAHEKSFDRCLIPLATDFSSFLEMLYQPEDFEY